jgi:hypothetical protein
MNDKIKELMYQAGTDSSGKWMGVSHAEKFAQLIVSECTQALEEMPRYFKTEHDRQVERDTIADCARTIQEHFGFK